MIKRVKNQATEWENPLAIQIPDRGLVSRIYEVLLRLMRKRQKMGIQLE